MLFAICRQRECNILITNLTYSLYYGAVVGIDICSTQTDAEDADREGKSEYWSLMLQ